MGWIRRQQQQHHPVPSAPSSTSSPSGTGTGNSAGGGGGGGRGHDLLPDLSDEALVLSAGTWLRPHLGGVRSKGDLARLDWKVSVM